MIRNIATAAAALVLIITAASAYMRLSQNGLGCVDWPACYGAVAATPRSAGIDAVRLVHRVAALAAGFLFVSIVIFGWNGRRGWRARAVLVMPLVLPGFLAWLGRHTRSTLPAVALGNVLGGMATLGILWWLRSVALAGAPVPNGASRAHAAAAIILLFVQIGLGVLISARLAGALCGPFPACGGEGAFSGAWTFNPFVETDMDRLKAGAGRSLHVAHRALGLVLVAYALWLGSRIRSGSGRIAGAGNAIIGLAVAQFAMGISMALFPPALWIAVAHNFAAGMMLMALVAVLARLRQSRRAGHRDDRVESSMRLR